MVSTEIQNIQIRISTEYATYNFTSTVFFGSEILIYIQSIYLDAANCEEIV
jgi:hypothetical protein